MVSHSKARPRLADFACGASCGDLYHPWTPSCARAVRDMLLSCVAGSCKFFAPVYAAQLLLNWRKINRSYLEKEARAFARSITFATCMGVPFIPVGCILLRLIGLQDYLSVFLPALVGGFGIFVEQPHKRGFLISSFTAMALEYMLRQLEDCGVFRMSHKLAALLFMASNGLLMYLLRCENVMPRARISNVWFFNPPPVKREKAGKLDKVHNKDIVKSLPHICPHKDTCVKHILKETSKYTLIGVGLQLLRKGIPQVRSLRCIPSILLRLLYNHRNMQFGVFLGAYIGIYTVVSCLLNQYMGHDSEMHAISAGAMAGLAYWFQPNRTFALTGFTTAIIMLARHLVQEEMVPCIPGFGGVLFAISFGLLLHARAFESHLCPQLATSITSTTTNGRCDFIADIFKNRQDAFLKNLKLVT